MSTLDLPYRVHAQIHIIALNDFVRLLHGNGLEFTCWADVGFGAFDDVASGSSPR